MKKVNIQSLSLMMLIAMICAAPHGQTDEQTDPKLLLDMIQEEVEKIILNKTMWKDIYVPEIPKKDHKRCVKHFFCLAEEALESTSLKNLDGLLHQYNKEKLNTNCFLNKNNSVTLHAVLEDIKICIKHALNETK